MYHKQFKYNHRLNGAFRWFAQVAAILFLSVPLTCQAQEKLSRVGFNPFSVSTKHASHHTARKTAALTLPFFDDFTGYSPIPDTTLWADQEAYVNNTYAVQPVSRGVATLDNLNSQGMPYDTLQNSAFIYGDSLTSQPIDMSFSAVTPSDSVYFSFFYQPQGNGYYPLPQDSLMLFFKNIFGDYKKVWSVPGPDTGSGLQAFRQVLVPITDSLFFGGQFQFRFVNIAATFWGGADWNIDYVRLNSGRFAADSEIMDVAITCNPSFLLNDYTSMPYSQFLANVSGELATTISDSLANSSVLSQNINHTFAVYDTTSGGSTAIFPAVSNNGLLPAYQTAQVAEPFTISASAFPLYPANSVVTFERQCYLRNTPFTGPTSNDTIA